MYINVILFGVFHKLAQYGVDITITHTKGEGVYYDLNTQMKSHAYVCIINDSTALVKMRYGSEVRLDLSDVYDDTVEEVTRKLVSIVSECGHGREYLSMGWSNAFDAFDIKFC